MAEKETLEGEFLKYTQKAGDISRQLGLAGIAVIWLFNVPHTGAPAAFSLASGLRCPLLLILLSLGIDAFQYAVGSLWLGVHWFRGKGMEEADKFYGAAGVLCLMIIGKLSIMAFAYYKLFSVLQSSIAWK